MKIKGKFLVYTSMKEMSVGQSGFLDIGAIFIDTKGSIYIDTNYSVSDKPEKEHAIPVKRTGDKKDDFEIDADISYCFDCYPISEDEKTPGIIGPYKVETEVFREATYRQQIFPRMHWKELLSSLIVANEAIFSLGSQEDDLKDQKAIKAEIIKKIEGFSLPELKKAKDTFKPATAEETEIGNINMVADEEIHHLICKRIKELRAETDEFKGKSIEDLKEEETIASESGDFKRAALIRDLRKQKEKEEKE